MKSKDNRRPVKPEQKDLLDRKPPMDLEAELCVLGSIVLSFESLDQISQIVTESDFYDDAHRRLYHNLLLMHQEGRRFDSALLQARLKKEGDFDIIGGAAFISKVINYVPNPAHAVYYAEIVRGHSISRSLIGACTKTLADAYEGSLSEEELVASAESAIARVSDATIRGRDTSPFSDVLHQALESIEQRMNGTHVRILNTGFDALQNCMGLVPGGVTILAGRTSQGKSSLAMDIVRYVANTDRRVYFASLEMSAQELVERILSVQSRLDGYKLSKGGITQDERMRLVEVAGDISTWPIDIDDRPTMTITQIAASARRIKRRYGRLDLLVIDYLQLVEPENRKDDRVEQIAKIMRGTKLMARAIEVPVLALVQVNRSSEENADRRPKLHQLRGSGDLEQDADSVVFVHRPAWYLTQNSNQNEQNSGQQNATQPTPTPTSRVDETAEIIVAKNRNGPTGTTEVLWRGQFMSFANKATPAQERDFA